MRQARHIKNADCNKKVANKAMNKRGTTKTANPRNASAKPGKNIVHDPLI